MKTYLKFAAGFWMSAFLITGSMATAQTTPTAKVRKKSSGSATNSAPTTNSDAGQTGATPSTTAPAVTPAAVTAHDQQNGTTSTTAPKTMVGPDKHTIFVPQQ
jgi:hypothetical protein